MSKQRGLARLPRRHPRVGCDIFLGLPFPAEFALGEAPSLVPLLPAMAFIINQREACFGKRGWRRLSGE